MTPTLLDVDGPPSDDVLQQEAYPAQFGLLKDVVHLVTQQGDAPVCVQRGGSWSQVYSLVEGHRRLPGQSKQRANQRASKHRHLAGEMIAVPSGQMGSGLFWNLYLCCHLFTVLLLTHLSQETLYVGQHQFTALEGGVVVKAG